MMEYRDVIKRLREIKKKGYIKTHRAGDTGIGEGGCFKMCEFNRRDAKGKYGYDLWKIIKNQFGNEEHPIRGFIFTCTNKSEKECFERNLFGTDKVYGPVVIRIRKGDLLFLHNLDLDVLWGVFKAVSNER